MYTKYLAHYKANRDKIRAAIGNFSGLDEDDRKTLRRILEEGYIACSGFQSATNRRENRKTASLDDGRYFAVVSREDASIVKNEIFVGEDGSRYRFKRDIKGYEIIEPNDVETIVGSAPFDISKVSRVLKIQAKEEA